MENLVEGLKALDFWSVVRAFAEELESLFVHGNSVLSTEELLSIIRPATNVPFNIFSWLREYVEQLDEKGMSTFQKELSCVPNQVICVLFYFI